MLSGSTSFYCYEVSPFYGWNSACGIANLCSFFANFLTFAESAYMTLESMRLQQSMWVYFSCRYYQLESKKWGLRFKWLFYYIVACIAEIWNWIWLGKWHSRWCWLFPTKTFLFAIFVHKCNSTWLFRLRDTSYFLIDSWYRYSDESALIRTLECLIRVVCGITVVCGKIVAKK